MSDFLFALGTYAPVISAASGLLSFGQTYLDSSKGKESARRNARAQKSQAESNAIIARKNLGIIDSQRNMFIDSQEELIGTVGADGQRTGGSIRDQGASVESSRLAMIAASGLGGAGTSSSQTAQNERVVNRDIGRVQAYMDAQVDVFDAQYDTTSEQAAQYDKQVTFAEESYFQNMTFTQHVGKLWNDFWN